MSGNVSENTKVIFPKFRKVNIEPGELKKERNVRKNNLILAFLVTIVLLTGFVVLHVYQYVRLSDVKAEITKIKISRDKFTKMMNDVELELVKLKNIKRIKSIAESRGMKQPDVIKFIDPEK